MAPPEEIYDDEREEDFDGEVTPGDGPSPIGEPDRSDEDVDREEDEAEERGRRSLEERAQRTQPRQDQQQPAGEVDRVMALLPEAYRVAVRAGTLTADAALSRHLENQRQHIGRIHTSNDQLKAELARSAAESRAREERTAARIERIMKAMGVEEEGAEGKLPTLEEDPARHLDGKLDQLRTELATTREEAARQAAEAQQSAALDHEAGQVRDWNANDYASVAAAVPDYDQAEEFLVGKVFAAEQLRLTEMYPSATADQIRATAAKNLHDMSATLQVRARQTGTSLAQEVYKAALANGYRQQPQAPPAPSRNRQRADAQLSRQRSAETIAGTPPRTAAPSEAEMWDKIINGMTDDEFEELFPDGPEGDKEFEALLRNFAHPA